MLYTPMQLWGPIAPHPHILEKTEQVCMQLTVCTSAYRIWPCHPSLMGTCYLPLCMQEGSCTQHHVIWPMGLWESGCGRVVAALIVITLLAKILEPWGVTQARSHASPDNIWTIAPWSNSLTGYYLCHATLCIYSFMNQNTEFYGLFKLPLLQFSGNDLYSDSNRILESDLYFLCTDVLKKFGHSGNVG